MSDSEILNTEKPATETSGQVKKIDLLASLAPPTPEKKSSVKKVNLLAELATPSQPTAMELIPLGPNATAIVLFTADGVEVKAHYVDEVEVRGFVHCCGNSCLLCRAGMESEGKILLPAVMPTEKRIGVLQFKAALRPDGLFNKLAPHLTKAASGTREVLMVQRVGSKFSVSAHPLKPSDWDGASLVSDFLDGTAAGTIDLNDAVQTLSTAQIWAVAKIRQMLLLTGATAP